MTDINARYREARQRERDAMARREKLLSWIVAGVIFGCFLIVAVAKGGR